MDSSSISPWTKILRYFNLYFHSRKQLHRYLNVLKSLATRCFSKYGYLAKARHQSPVSYMLLTLPGGYSDNLLGHLLFNGRKVLWNHQFLFSMYYLGPISIFFRCSNNRSVVKKLRFYISIAFCMAFYA